jgi:hypothetical protein
MTAAREEHVRAIAQAWYRRVTANPSYAPNTTLEETLRYALAVDNAIDTAKPSHAVVRPWLTDRCPECGVRVSDMRPHEKDEHLIVSGYVVIACEWYWVVNPAAVGVACDPWCDWQEGMSPDDLKKWYKTGVSH